MKIKLEFKLQDLWIGIFWKTHKYEVIKNLKFTHFSVDEYNGLSCGGEVVEAIFVNQIDVWICLIPCFPIHLIFNSERK